MGRTCCVLRTVAERNRAAGSSFQDLARDRRPETGDQRPAEGAGGFPRYPGGGGGWNQPPHSQRPELQLEDGQPRRTIRSPDRRLARVVARGDQLRSRIMTPAETLAAPQTNPTSGQTSCQPDSAGHSCQPATASSRPKVNRATEIAPEWQGTSLTAAPAIAAKGCTVPSEAVPSEAAPTPPVGATRDFAGRSAMAFAGRVASIVDMV